MFNLGVEKVCCCFGIFTSIIIYIWWSNWLLFLEAAPRIDFGKGTILVVLRKSDATSSARTGSCYHGQNRKKYKFWRLLLNKYGFCWFYWLLVSEAVPLIDFGKASISQPVQEELSSKELVALLKVASSFIRTGSRYISCVTVTYPAIYIQHW